jgi:hypothetical protein
MLLLNTEFYPGHRTTHILLGVVRLEQADTAGALLAGERALELEPQDAELRRRLDQIRR